jgi:hypothetical protein
MRSTVTALLFLAASAAVPASMAAMSSAHGTHAHCRLVAGEKALAGLPGTSSLCAEIEKAVAAAAPHARYSAEVRALSPSRLSATLVVDGRTLPEQNFAVSDRNLGPDSIRRFAQALSAEVAKAAKR